MAKSVEALRGQDRLQAGPDGGVVHECDPDTGETLADIYVPPGEHKACRFMVGVGRRSILVVGEGVYSCGPRSRHHVNDFGELHHETVASQTFRVDRSLREKRRNDRLERLMGAQERRLAAVLSRLETARRAETVVDQGEGEGDEAEVQADAAE